MSIEFRQGDVLSYMEMCSAVGASLQRGMNFRLRNAGSVFLMSRRRNAPYNDRVDEVGGTLIYEGHDCSKSPINPDPKKVDQPERTPLGQLTQNGLFLEAVRRCRNSDYPFEKVRVFEKIMDGIWVYNGLFELFDAWKETSEGRQVYKFNLRLIHFGYPNGGSEDDRDIDDDRIIPSQVKQQVWKRDQGRCRVCKSTKGLHFDHIIPYSKGGSSKDVENIQILCGRHNLQKRDRIE